MSAALLNFVCEQGTDWTRTITLQSSLTGPVIDLTGYQAKMQVRNAPGGSILLSLSSVSGGISLGGTNGQLTLSIAHAQTGALNLSSLPIGLVSESNDPHTVTPSYSGALAVYDLELIDPVGNVSRLLYGQFCIVPEVTF